MEASTWIGGGPSVHGGEGDNHYYIPTNPRGSSRYGRPWAMWYSSDGQDGEEPPEDIRRALELHDRMRNTYDPDEAVSMGMQIMEISRERFFYMGISTPPPGYGIVRKDFRNVPRSMPGAGGFMPPGPTRPEQYFVAE